jgi:hypothetical protein
MTMAAGFQAASVLREEGGRFFAWLFAGGLARIPRAGMHPLRNVVLGLLALSLAACSTLDSAPCGPGEQRVVQDMLYFGTEMPSGRVTPDDWARFLAEVVTPCFPEGLTAWRASGQWRSATGTVMHEESHVLSLVHGDDAGAERAIREIVASYKARFRQEAVLRVRSFACMSR